MLPFPALLSASQGNCVVHGGPAAAAHVLCPHTRIRCTEIGYLCTEAHYLGSGCSWVCLSEAAVQEQGLLGQGCRARCCRPATVRGFWLKGEQWWYPFYTWRAQGKCKACVGCLNPFPSLPEAPGALAAVLKHSRSTVSGGHFYLCKLISHHVRPSPLLDSFTLQMHPWE